MVGNPSIPAVTLSALALHATIATPYNIVAEEASTTVDDRYHWSRSGPKRTRLRRHDDDVLKPVQKRPLGLDRNILESSRRGEDFLQDSFLGEEDEKMVSSSSIIDRSSESEHRRLKSCMGWHAEMNNQDGCSNDVNYPDSWRKSNNSISPGLRQSMFHKTEKACCDFFFPDKTCEVYSSDCKAPGSAPPPSSSSSCKWHPDMTTQNGCSNDDNYPEEWLEPRVASHMFHATAQKCCDEFYLGKSCELYDRGCQALAGPAPEPAVPPPEPTDPPSEPAGPPPEPAAPLPEIAVPPVNVKCVSPGWHPDIRNQDGCSDGEDQWLQAKMKTNMFQQSSSKCCERFYPGKDCKVYEDGCKIDPNIDAASRPKPTPKPTRRPHNGPTPKPTSEPTSAAPTITPPVYYMEHFSGICLDEDEHPRPHYTTETFLSRDACCHSSFAKDKCFAAIPKSGDQGEKNIQDKVIELNFYGSMSLQLPNIPKSGSSEWSVLKNALIKTLTSVMLKSPIVTEGLVVELFTFAGQSFQYRFRRRLNKRGTDEKNEDVLSSHWARTKRRASASQSLQFEMTIPVRCDAACQSGHDSMSQLGHALFYELESHLEYYVDSGVLSSVLLKMFELSGLFSESDVPPVTLGVLTYRSAVLSSETLIPTWSPTSFLSSPKPTFRPLTKKPSSQPNTSPTKSDEVNTKCESAAAFHPIEDFSAPTCTNSRSYPELWNSPGARPFFLFETGDDCCSYFRFEQCNIEDVCASDGETQSKLSNLSTTGNPTPSPATQKPSRSPIIHYEWYVEQNTQKCVQDCAKRYGPTCGGQKSKWADSFSTVDECCNKISWKSYSECASTAFPTDTPTIAPSTPQPTSKPTKRPTHEPSPLSSTMEPTPSPVTECSASRWYYKRENDLCTNDSLYPSLWNIEPALGSKFLFDTVDGCCAANSPGICSVKDKCDYEWPPYCDGMYHPTTPALRICSNDGFYPVAWNNDPEFMFQSREECCKSFYGDGLCLIKDACY
ncbi:hypothetical protein ACHAXR_012659 [Thalassiosira sp. AJA248-18]